MTRPSQARVLTAHDVALKVQRQALRLWQQLAAVRDLDDPMTRSAVYTSLESSGVMDGLLDEIRKAHES